MHTHKLNIRKLKSKGTKDNPLKNNKLSYINTHVHTCAILTSAHTRYSIPQKHTLTEHEHIKHTCIHSYTCRDTHTCSYTHQCPHMSAPLPLTFHTHASSRACPVRWHPPQFLKETFSRQSHLQHPPVMCTWRV